MDDNVTVLFFEVNTGAIFDADDFAQPQRDDDLSFGIDDAFFHDVSSHTQGLVTFPK